MFYLVGQPESVLELPSLAPPTSYALNELINPNFLLRVSIPVQQTASPARRTPPRRPHAANLAHHASTQIPNLVLAAIYIKSQILPAMPVTQNRVSDEVQKQNPKHSCNHLSPITAVRASGRSKATQRQGPSSQPSAT